MGIKFVTTCGKSKFNDINFDKSLVHLDSCFSKKFIQLTLIALAQDVVAHPNVAAEMVEVHLIVVANFFFVMSVRVATEYNQVITCKLNHRLPLGIRYYLQLWHQ